MAARKGPERWAITEVAAAGESVGGENQEITPE
jgi:hypothetical protein